MYGKFKSRFCKLERQIQITQSAERLNALKTYTADFSDLDESIPEVANEDNNFYISHDHCYLS